MLLNLSQFTYFGFGMPGFGEMLVIFFVILLLFGGSKAPQIAKALGQVMREFKKIVDDVRFTDKDEDK